MFIVSSCVDKQCLHIARECRDKPVVAVNCGAIPENLIQSELFGYEKGAFTGANKQKLGQIEMASGGTLFLDEVGDLPYDMQVNLLRFLQEKVIQRVGGNEEIPIDVRVISATNVDLDGAIKQGRFREDLLYRLNVLQILTPALRDRGSDIELLTNFFFEHFVSEGQGRLKGFSQQALMAIQQHRWPGNVREPRIQLPSATLPYAA
nr:sigma 54-interacting transcriptional regulator [Amphritea atlantica]